VDGSAWLAQLPIQSGVLVGCLIVALHEMQMQSTLEQSNSS